MSSSKSAPVYRCYEWWYKLFASDWTSADQFEVFILFSTLQLLKGGLEYAYSYWKNFTHQFLYNLFRNLIQTQNLTENESATIGLDILRGLNYLHLHSPPIIHRDISSANVLLYKTENLWKAKVSDYGTANYLIVANTIQPGAQIYAAPEVLNGQAQTAKVIIIFCL